MLDGLHARLDHADTAVWKRRTGLALLFVVGAFALPFLELAEFVKTVSQSLRSRVRSRSRPST